MDPSLNLKTRCEEIEDLASYANTLSPKDKEWLNRFSEEYICANMNHSGTKLHKKKTQIKSIYDKNNARNRCIYTREKAQGCMNYLEDMKERQEIEDVLTLDESEQ